MPGGCLSVSIVMNRNNEKGKSFKGHHLNGAGLQILKFSPFSSKQKAWQYPGSHSAGRGESSTS